MSKHRTTVRANPNNWSDASKRTVLFDHPPEVYRGLDCVCWNCKNKFVFSAQQQRDMFEVRKAYISQQRLLCPACFRARLELERELDGFNVLWSNEREKLASDKGSLARWRTCLQQLPYYGVKRNRAHLAMLDRLLSDGA